MTTNDSKIFGKKLKQLREAKNMTKTQLAEKAQLSVSTITNYETGYTMPNHKKIQSLSYALGTNLNMDNKSINPNLKVDQKFYTNDAILFYNLDNISGLLTLDKSMADNIFYLDGINTSESEVFATKIKDDTMSKSFMVPGELAFFRYDPEPDNNTIVMVYIKAENKIVIRYYACEDNIVILTDNSYYTDPEHKQYYRDDIKIIGPLVKRIISGNH